MPAGTLARPKTPRPVEVIYSCSICQKTIHELYKHIESDQGFRADNDHYTSEPVTKLWMTECAHLTCSEHLQGGGIPFHAASKQPKLPCPYCSKHGDKTPKHLYGIRGFNKGQFDGGIPSAYFDTPPVEFKGDSTAMNALSFHYRQLCHFATNLYVKYHEAESRAENYLGKARDGETTAQEAQNQVNALKKRVSDLEHCEIELKPWKEREGKIKHYLQTFTEVVAENDKLREQLLALGYAVPRRSWSLHSSATSSSDKPALPAGRGSVEPTITSKRPNSPQRQSYQIANAISPEAASSSDRTISAPHKPVANLHTTNTDQPQETRKRVSADEIGESARPRKSPRTGRSDSRGLMPPPALPFKRPPGMASPQKPDPPKLRHMQGTLPQFIRPDQRIDPRPVPKPRPLSDMESVQDTAMHDVGRDNRGSNIFTSQESSPQRPDLTYHNYLNDDEFSEMPILDPRKHGELNIDRSSDHQQNRRGSLETAPRLIPQGPPFHERELQHVNMHDASNLVRSDPGSVIYSPTKTSRQRSDPTQAVAASPFRRPLQPKKLNDSIVSPFFTESNRAPSHHKRLTLPTRARAGTSGAGHQSQSSQFNINNLSFINRPYKATSNERISSGMSHYGHPHAGIPATPGRTNDFVQRPESNIYNQRGATRHSVNAPFRPPQPIMQPQTPYAQQQQVYDHNFYAQQMTPQQPYRQYPAGTPILLPSRVGTAASGQGMDFHSRLAGFGYNGGGGYR